MLTLSHLRVVAVAVAVLVSRRLARKVISKTRGWRNEDPEPRVGEGGGPAKGQKKNCDLTDFDGGSGR